MATTRTRTNLKRVPGFRAEDEERKPSLRTISLRLPVSMIEDLKVLANRREDWNAKGRGPNPHISPTIGKRPSNMA
jgi:hypothetical protein